MHKRTRTKFWLGVAAFVSLISMANSTVIRVTVPQTTPAVYNFIRFAVVVIVCLPFLFRHYKTITKKNILYVLLAAFFTAVAIIVSVQSLYYVQASYVAVINLLIPILLIVYSVLLTKERIHKQAVTGVTLAALGGLMVIGLPIALHSSNIPFRFNLEGTLFSLVNCITYPLATIFFKKASDKGASLMTSLSVSFIVGLLFAAYELLSSGQWGRVGDALVNPSILLSAIYSGWVVSLLARYLNVLSYEHLGSAAIAAFGYIDSLLSIIFPMVVLHEQLPGYVLFGGILILFGVYLIESRMQWRISRHFHLYARHH